MQTEKEAAAIQRGAIFWLEPDEAHGSVPGQAHPHVVIQEDVFNRSRIDTVIVCALTTNLSRAHEPGNVLLDPGEGNLPKQTSWSSRRFPLCPRPNSVLTLGRCPPQRVEQILDGLRFQQASFFGQR